MHLPFEVARVVQFVLGVGDGAAHLADALLAEHGARHLGSREHEVVLGLLRRGRLQLEFQFLLLLGFG